MLSDAKALLGLAIVPAVLGLALLTSGCNTMRGMGEDVEAAGGAMSSTAEATEEKIEGTMSEEEDTEMEEKERAE
jgi:predicted small secreted protein